MGYSRGLFDGRRLHPCSGGRQLAGGQRLLLEPRDGSSRLVMVVMMVQARGVLVVVV